MPLVYAVVCHRIEADRIFAIGSVDDDHIIRPAGGNFIKQIIGQIAMRVDNGNSPRAAGVVVDGQYVDEERAAHVYMIGRSGMGKTTALYRTISPSL